MMKKMLIPVVLLIFFGVGAVRAMVPPDAATREPQLRRERIEVERKYEKYIEEQRVIAVQRHRNVMAGLDYPPWKRNADGTPKPGATLSSRTRERREAAGHRWLFGLSGLLGIGIVFWLIKQMTREADSR